MYLSNKVFVFLVAMVMMLALQNCAICRKEVKETVATTEKTPEKEVIVGTEQYRHKEELNNIYFDFDQYVLRPEATEELRKIGTWLHKNPSIRIRIEGNCDDRGTNEYNLALGERRSVIAKNYLINLGVSADRISTISFGEENPAVSGNNEEAWAKNRRDEFKTAD
jgi:peptidoglycan-associated lipoprotein